MDIIIYNYINVYGNIKQDGSTKNLEKTEPGGKCDVRCIFSHLSRESMNINIHVCIQALWSSKTGIRPSTFGISPKWIRLAIKYGNKIRSSPSSNHREYQEKQKLLLIWFLNVPECSWSMQVIFELLKTAIFWGTYLSTTEKWNIWNTERLPSQSGGNLWSPNFTWPTHVLWCFLIVTTVLMQNLMFLWMLFSFLMG